ncbi:Glutaredoxin 3 [Pseudomonas fluorescens]|uniref:Glutaredoxin n=1 Tax=Pseudomonas fluorescens TaxID=294 RepID=A0A8H2RKN1_PSEFL|nr:MULTISPECIES: glutaredoxin 3 [Pseudomonas]CAG8871504.1 Glutaredoxin 3 [Pseudomonas fluorescens]VVO38490.1 Glutaredoxin 3 [Pseudomonas fluorescens]VVP24128.1 Glutaredoxin 3 [Pseudomonas fluorescens]VVP98158.1 Glutaredoxin 3 [Pseudomonas fluorescens]
MNTVTLYTTDTCPYCRNAKALLASKGAVMQEINIEREPGKMQEMLNRSGRRSVPQIFIGDTHIGGFDDLAKLDRQGGLMSMLA